MMSWPLSHLFFATRCATAAATSSWPKAAQSGLRWSGNSGAMSSAPSRTSTASAGRSTSEPLAPDTPARALCGKARAGGPAAGGLPRRAAHPRRRGAGGPRQPQPGGGPGAEGFCAPSTRSKPSWRARRWPWPAARRGQRRPADRFADRPYSAIRAALGLESSHTPPLALVGAIAQVAADIAQVAAVLHWNDPLGTVCWRRAERHFLSRWLSSGECAAKFSSPELVAPGHDEYDSGLRDRLRRPRARSSQRRPQHGRDVEVATAAQHAYHFAFR